MKRLVKTARQQFEERVRELGNHKPSVINGETFHSGIDKQGNFHILRIGDADVEYSEFDYECPLLELYNDDVFLYNITSDFVNDRREVKAILEWWSDADKCHEPFDLSDIVKFAPVSKFVVFKDIYEEVPDVRVITAKEQWENDSKDAKLCCNLDNGTIWKVLVEKDQLVFFRSNDEDRFYHRYDLPSMDNLRKDAAFIAEYLGLVQDMHPEDLDSAIAWIKKGVYTMSDCSMMDIYQSSKTQGSYEYEDKEVELTKKKDFSNEIAALQNTMIDYIVKLHTDGMNLDSKLFIENAGSIITADDVAFDAVDIRACYFRVDSDGVYQFSTEYDYDAEGDSNDFVLGELSIETLHQIIKAMK